MDTQEAVGNAVGRWVLAGCLWGLILLLFTGCQSPQARDAASHVAETWTEINADGVVTPEEQDRYALAVEAWMDAARKDAEGLDWESIAVAFGGAVSTAFLGINIFRNRREQKVWGPPQPPTQP